MSNCPNARIEKVKDNKEEFVVIYNGYRLFTGKNEDAKRIVLFIKVAYEEGRASMQASLRELLNVPSANDVAWKDWRQ